MEEIKSKITTQFKYLNEQKNLRKTKTVKYKSMLVTSNN